MKYFTFKEFEDSDKAKELKIDNTIPGNCKQKIIELCDNLLDPLREAWGGPIKITSGYRCDELNKIVGGSKTSAHFLGYAADLYPHNGRIEEFKKFVKNFLLTRNFDQCIDESDCNSNWVHIGYKNSKGQQRRQYLKYVNGKYYKWI